MRMLSLACCLAISAAVPLSATISFAQEVLPWERKSQQQGNYPNNDYAPRTSGRSKSQVPNSYGSSQNRNSSSSGSYSSEPQGTYRSRSYDSRSDDYRRAPDNYRREYTPPPRYAAPREPEPRYSEPRYGANDSYNRRRYEQPPIEERRDTFSESEIVNAGHKFFGKLSKGLAKTIEYAFRSKGRPNGYILGEDAGGAFIAGLRYGEGRLYTKYGQSRRVYWQGPSIGYDFGGEGTRTMVLVYNLRGPRDVYRRFGGVQGSAYVIGGASVQFLTNGDITLAPIRTGVGLRLGANIGYLKYTRRPTWNPF
ncbi:MAG: DUF1134 domain-containing protein [Pseudomonadota bacterium]